MPRLEAIPVLAALLAVALPSAARAQDTGFESVLARYRAYVERPSLHKRTEGRRMLAETRDPRALEVLAKSYGSAEDPADQVRYLITSITMDAFGNRADPEVLAQWRDRHDDPNDAWLWYETLSPFAGRDVEGIREIVLGKEDEFLRAAALEALAAYADEHGMPAGASGLCMDVLADLPRDDAERALMLESVARMVLAARGAVRGPQWEPVAAGLIAEMESKETPNRTLVVLSRYFSKTFGVSNLGLEARWWRSELERKPVEPRRDGETRSVPFFEVRTFGTRFVYVIDASDSMLRRMTENEKRDMGPVTGTGGKRTDDPKEIEIDWSRVVTRFDAAREYLRQSLMSLQKEDEFAVVLFGDSAEPLDATPKLVSGTPGNIRAAIAELEDIEARPPTQERPDGVLLGRTNLHAGIRCAFELTRRGKVRGAEYVDAKGLMDGADTIFVLSDGKPAWQDWAAQDSRDPGDLVGDQEVGTQIESDAKILTFFGPYGTPPWDALISDIERLNLFRKCEIHCIGLGEADAALLRDIAEIGMGQMHVFRGT